MNVRAVVGSMRRYPSCQRLTLVARCGSATGNRAPANIRIAVHPAGWAAIAGILLAACSSAPTAATHVAPGSPRTVCSLVNTAEVSAALGEPAYGPSGCTVQRGSQSIADYVVQGKIAGTLLEVSLAWSTTAVTTFTTSHSGHARYTTQQGAPVAPPTFTKVTVAGVPAYWQVTPVPEPGDPKAMRISALKNGYVVSVYSSELSQLQDEKVLGAVLTNL